MMDFGWVEMDPGRLPGARLGPYEVIREIGRGGMGTVFLAFDQRLRREVAVKVIGSRVDATSEARERFFREARSAAAATHANIAAVYDVGEDGGTAYLAMEHINGGSLRNTANRGVVPLEQALALVKQIALALAAAHRKGVVHGDIKPENVLMRDDGSVAVVDFGIARSVCAAGGERTLTTLSAGALAGAGTPGYMAPEQILGAAVDGRADLFSLGVVLYELVAGTHPFRAANGAATAVATLVEHPAPLSKSGASIPAWVDSLTATLLSKDPSARPASADDVVGAIVAGSFGATTPGGAVNSLFRPAVLPAYHDSFVGRDGLVEDLLRILRAGGRPVLTLTGPGGVGKTRLAARLAERWQHESPTSFVVFCDLTEDRTLDGVVASIARSVGARASSAGNTDAMVEVVGTTIAAFGTGLIVLDNFEQVAAVAAAVVGRLAERARNARFLVTSREPLRLTSEHVWQLDPLGTEEGCALFCDRFREVSHGSAPVGEDLERIRAIVALLDGIPLALELAAARVRMMSLADLQERLGRRFQILGRARRDGPARHATLRATLEWSWDLLNDDERSALVQLRVFVGGFSLAAAEAVLRLDGPALVVDVVEGLHEKGLLRNIEVPGAPRRFATYVSVHELVVEKAGDAAGDADEASRHADYFARLAEDLRPRINSTTVEGIAAFDLDRENYLAVARRAGAVNSTAPAVTHALRVLIAVSAALHGLPVREVAALTARVLSRAQGLRADRSLVTMVKLERVGLARLIEEPSLLRAEILAAMDVASEIGDQALLAYSHWRLAMTYYDEWNLDAGDDECRAARALWSDLGDLGGLTGVDSVLADTPLFLADYETAAPMLKQAAASATLSRDEVWGAVTLAHEAILKHETGLIEDARRLYAEALCVLRDTRALRFIATVSALAAILDIAEGRDIEAEAGLTNAMEAARQNGVPRAICYCQALRGGVRALSGRLADGEKDITAALLDRWVARDPVWGPSVALQLCTLDVARAEAARENGNSEAHQLYREAALSRLRELHVNEREVLVRRGYWFRIPLGVIARRVCEVSGVDIRTIVASI